MNPFADVLDLELFHFEIFQFVFSLLDHGDHIVVLERYVLPELGPLVAVFSKLRIVFQSLFLFVNLVFLDYFLEI